MSRVDGSAEVYRPATQLMMTTIGSVSREAEMAASPSPTSLLVHSIRGRIVEYKELLLRQLVDQRVALLAIDDVGVIKPKRLKEEVEERAVHAIDATATIKARVEESRSLQPDVALPKRGGDDAVAVNGVADVDMVEPNGCRKRTASPMATAGAEDVAIERAVHESKTVEPEATEKQPTETVVRVVKRRRSSISLDTHLPSGGQAVQRTSLPPRRYLLQREEDEAVGDDHDDLVLRLARPSQRTLMSKQSQLHSKALGQPKSIDDIHTEFEQKLRVTTRLQREMADRRVAMTRKRQLPRLAMPARTKTHWDLLLEEMRCMATDFSTERNWKRVLQWHVAKDVVVKLNEERVRREKENRQRAREMATQVAAFWRSMERIAARSHSRFEEGGAREKSDPVRVQEESAASVEEAVGDENKVVVVKLKTIEVSSPEEAQDVEDVKQRLQQIVSSSRKSRRFLRPSPSISQDDQERVIQRLVESRSAVMLAAFQLIALRWMLSMCLSGFNVLLNDQLGMGKASTVSSCLRVLQMLDEAARGDDPAPLEISRPHLVVVPADEVHKWCHYLRCWNEHSGIIQVYGGTAAERKKQQRVWSKKLNLPSFFSAEDVMELEEEDQTPVFACVCAIEDFVEDKAIFAAYTRWQALVIEKDSSDLFEDVDVVRCFGQLVHSGRRILACSQPLESWSSSKIRQAYAGLLLNCLDNQQQIAWSKKTLVDKTSALEMAKWLGSSSSSVLKTQAQQDQLTAMTLALHCLTLRRVRSEVESQLGKLDEQSIACKLTQSQKTQYRNAVAAFVASNTSASKDRVDQWLAFFLQLRRICNCVDLLNDPEKLALADLPFLFSSSTKLENLHELLARLVAKEKQRVVVYCQLDALFPVLEMLLALMDVTFVQVTGSVESQRRALSHFALRPSVQVALVSTRVGGSGGRVAMPVYGADAIVVVDSDWQATGDAKLRATWAKCLVGKPSDVAVYRFHCDATIEAALLRGGSCLTDKILGELSPQDAVGEVAGGAATQKLHKPSWWTSSGGGGGAGGSLMSITSRSLAEAEASDRYSACELEESSVLKVVDVELDADEHLLLANADELMPVEWYAVNYVHTSASERKRVSEAEQEDGSERSKLGGGDSGHHRVATFEQVAAREAQHAWQSVDAMDDLFYFGDDAELFESGKNDDVVRDLLRPLRDLGLEPQYDLLRPPLPPTGAELVHAEPFTDDVLFKVSYREPAPPVPALSSSTSLTFKLHPDGTTTLAGASGDKPLKMKKRNKDLMGRLAAAAGGAGMAGASGLKRKHENASAGAKPLKEPRLDFDGIPIPQDMAEFADDDFWGDTNLDALDSATWDDPAVLSGILGPTLDASPSKASAAGGGSAGTTGGGASATTKKKNKASAGGGAGPGGASGRVRKGSISGDASKDAGWQVQDDLILKKLFELYGSNWTLIAHVLNTSTSVSRFVFRRRTPRQCYDRYGKIISSSGLSATATPTKDGGSSKSLVKQQKLNAAAAVLWTPQVLAERVGLPASEVLMVFHARDSLPGLPPPSVTKVPTLVELSLRKKKKTQKNAAIPVMSATTTTATATAAAGADSATPGTTTTTTAAPVSTMASNGLDDLKPLRTSFDAIIQCMKRKTPPPPIPIPQPASATTETPATAPQSSPSKRTGPSIVTPVPTTATAPHKSHVDLVELLPRVPLAPDEVIKRSKEAAAVAVQAAAAVASASSSSGVRVPVDVSPASDAMASSAFSARKAAMATRVGTALGLGGDASLSKLGGANSTAWGATVATPVHHALPSLSPSANGASPRASRPSTPAMPVTTSALLHVLDRMPEIKHKIQAILNRSDCSEPQKVAMIARLLSNTNAINATAVAAAASGNLSAAVSATLGAASAASSTVPASVPIADPLPMPAALAAAASSDPVADAAASAALASALDDTDLADLASPL